MDTPLNPNAGASIAPGYNGSGALSPTKAVPKAPGIMEHTETEITLLAQLHQDLTKLEELLSPISNPIPVDGDATMKEQERDMSRPDQRLLVIISATRRAINRVEYVMKTVNI